jgi:hypothetical protein
MGATLLDEWQRNLIIHNRACCVVVNRSGHLHRHRRLVVFRRHAAQSARMTAGRHLNALRVPFHASGAVVPLLSGLPATFAACVWSAVTATSRIGHGWIDGGRSHQRHPLQ